jgi:demethylmenaquinone methyltransferase/2-methoxy-6-polyprenyl-1,4-benzoquinol methylase
MPAITTNNAKQLLKQGYDSFYQRFYSIVGNLDQHYYQDGLKLLNAQRGERILEIGFGGGRFLATIAKAVGHRGRLYGVELSKKSAEAAQRRLKRAKLTDRSEIYTADATNLPLGIRSIDGIFMAFTLDAIPLPQIPEVLGECMKVLRPGGRLSIVAHHASDHPGILYRLREWLRTHTKLGLSCQPLQTQTWLEKSGFRVSMVKVTSMRGLPVEVLLAYKPVA